MLPKLFSVSKAIRHGFFATMASTMLFVSTRASGQATTERNDRGVSQGGRTHVVSQSNGSIVVQNQGAGSFVQFSAGGAIVQSKWENSVFIPGVVGPMQNVTGANLQIDHGTKNITINIAPGASLDSTAQSNIIENVIKILRRQNADAKETLKKEVGINPPASTGASDLHVTFVPDTTTRKADSVARPIAVEAFNPVVRPVITPNKINTGAEHVKAENTKPVLVQGDLPCPWHITHSHQQTSAWLTPGVKRHHFNDFIINDTNITATVAVKLPVGRVTAALTIVNGSKLTIQIHDMQTKVDKALAQRELTEFLNGRGRRELANNISQISSGDCTSHVAVGRMPPAEVSFDQPPSVTPTTTTPCDSLKAENDNLKKTNLKLQTEVESSKNDFWKGLGLGGLATAGLATLAFFGLRRRPNGNKPISPDNNPIPLVGEGERKTQSLNAPLSKSNEDNSGLTDKGPQNFSHRGFQLISNPSINENLLERFHAAKKLVTEFRKNNITREQLAEGLKKVSDILPAAFKENPADAFIAARYVFNMRKKELGIKDYAILHKIAENFSAIEANNSNIDLGRQSMNFVLRNASDVMGKPLRDMARSRQTVKPSAPRQTMQLVA